MEIDITSSVLIDNAAEEFKKAAEEIAKKYGFSADVAMLAMEKAAMEMKEAKMKIYASALLKGALQGKEKVDVDEQSAQP